MCAFIYILFSTYPRLFQTQYHFSVGLSGLAYVGIGVGDVLAAFLCTKYAALATQKSATLFENGAVTPESRLPVLAVVVPLVPVGLLWTGWSAEDHTHWIVPELGSAPIGFGIVASSIFGQLYMVDAYTKYAASCIAASSLFRSVLGAVLPIVCGPLYARLGFGKGNTILAAVSVLNVVTAGALVRYGAMLRSRFPFEKETLKDDSEGGKPEDTADAAS
ncbi:MAG: hypothetical protein Q9159_006447 [Coniocarpon cinnabarinum]